MKIVKAMLNRRSCGGQVNELRTQNEYQLRLKDMAQNEKIREINEKYTAELESSKLKLEGFIQVSKSLLSFLNIADNPAGDPAGSQ